MLKKTNKNIKSQISIFIIIGTVLLISSISLFFFLKPDILITTEQKYSKQITNIIVECSYDNAKQGVTFLGLKGGKLKNEGLNDRRNYINFGVKIPNWDDEFSNVPSIKDMENELEDYILETSRDCIINNLRVLEDEIKIISDFDMSVIAKINNLNVEFFIGFPIEFNERTSNKKYYIKDFYINLEDVPLGEIYDLAINFYNSDRSQNFLESLTLEQILSASDYQSPNSIPSEGLLISCEKRVWTYTQLKRNMINLMNNNFRLLEIKNTFEKGLVDRYINKDNRQYYKNFYIFDIGLDKKYDDYKFEVFFPNTYIDSQNGINNFFSFRNFEVYPGDGVTTQSVDFNHGENLDVPLPCIQTFSHKYDLDYDLIVKITHLSKENEFFIFQFPLRQQIEKNVPKSIYNPIIDESENGLTATSQEFCRIENRNFNVKIEVRNEDEIPLNGANLKHKCLNLRCDLGQTQKPSFSGIQREFANPFFSGKIGECFGGEIEATLNGYHKNSIKIDTFDENKKLIEKVINLRQYKNFLVNSNTILLVDENGVGKRVFNKNDGSIFISFKNKKEDFSKFLFLPNENQENLELFLGEEIYNITAFYTNKEEEILGFAQIKNYKINSDLGNEIFLKIPFSSSPLTDKDFEDIIKGNRNNNFNINLV